MAGQGQRSSGSTRVTPKMARIMGFNSPQQMIDSPNFESKMANLNKKTRSTIDQYEAATGRKMTVQGAVNYMYNRL